MSNSSTTESMKSPPPLTEEYREQIHEFRTALDEHAYDDLVNLAPSLLEHISNHHTSSNEQEGKQLKQAVQQAYAQALLHQGNFHEALQVVTSKPKQDTRTCTAARKERESISDNTCTGTSFTQLLHAYALYRQDDYVGARNTCQAILKSAAAAADDDDDGKSQKDFILEACHHLLAQSLYHIHEPRLAMEEYQGLLKSIDLTTTRIGNNDECMDIWTNLTAILLSEATPYVASEENTERLQTIQKFVRNQRDEDDLHYDLVANLATLQLWTDPEKQHHLMNTKLLQHAEKACMVQNRDEAEHALKEAAPLHHNLVASRALWNGSVLLLSDHHQQQQQQQQAKKKSTSAPTPLALIQQMHRAIAANAATEGLSIVKDAHAAHTFKKLTPLQQRLWHYNHAILQYRAGKYADCLNECDNLWHALQPLSAGKKKKLLQQQQQQHLSDNNGDADASLALATHSSQALLWWEARLAVLKMYCRVQQQQQQQQQQLVNNATTSITNTTKATAQAIESIKTLLQMIQKHEPSSWRDHLLCYLQVHIFSLEQQQHQQQHRNETENSISDRLSDMIQFLTSDALPESIRTKPAVLATLASLYQASGQSEQAQRLLSDPTALADFAMAQGDYERAVSLYQAQVEATSNKDPVIVAQWVQALSHIDPEKAMKIWSELSVPDLEEEKDDSDQVTGAELEVRELPRLKTTRKTVDVWMPNNATGTGTIGVEGTIVDDTKKRKSHESVLRRRARKRDEYLTTLEQKGLYRKDRPTQPNPERWIPKYERSYARRRKHRGGGGGGAQGGVSKQDAAKLDVAARQAARASGEAPIGVGKSTAHMTVSASGGLARKSKGTATSSSSRRR